MVTWRSFFVDEQSWKRSAAETAAIQAISADGEALQLHMQQEPDDLVMRAKADFFECQGSIGFKVLPRFLFQGPRFLGGMLPGGGGSLFQYMLLESRWIYVQRKQCKEYPKAEEHYMAAYHLLLQTVGYGEFRNSQHLLWNLFQFDVSGKQSPLFGKQARHAAANWELRLSREGVETAIELPRMLGFRGQLANQSRSLRRGRLHVKRVSVENMLVLVFNLPYLNCGDPTCLCVELCWGQSKVSDEQWSADSDLEFRYKSNGFNTFCEVFVWMLSLVAGSGKVERAFGIVCSRCIWCGVLMSPQALPFLGEALTVEASKVNVSAPDYTPLCTLQWIDVWNTWCWK